MLLGGGSSCQKCGCGTLCVCDDTNDSSNPCCGTSCLPCSLTVSITPGSTWASAINLPTGDRNDIITFCTKTFVLSCYGESGYGDVFYGLNRNNSCTIPGGFDRVTNWYGCVLFYDASQLFQPCTTGSTQSWNYNLDNDTQRCYGILSRGSNSTPGGVNQISIGDFGLGGSNGSVRTLPSGSFLREATIAFSPSSANWAMPFGLDDWCGLSSWSYSFATPYNYSLYDSYSGVTRTYQTSITVSGDDGAGTAFSGTLRGHTVDFSW